MNFRDLGFKTGVGSDCWDTNKATHQEQRAGSKRGGVEQQVWGLRGQVQGTGGSRCRAFRDRPTPLSHNAVTLQLTASEEEFLRTYAGVVNSQLSQLPQHSIDQGEPRARHQPSPPRALSSGSLQS